MNASIHNRLQNRDVNAQRRRPLPRVRTALWAAVVAWAYTAQAGGRAADRPDGDTRRALVRLSVDQVDSVLAGRSKVTGWLLVWMTPPH